MLREVHSITAVKTSLKLEDIQLIELLKIGEIDLCRSLPYAGKGLKH